MSRLFLLLIAASLFVGSVSAQGAYRRSVPEPSFPPVSQPWSLSDVNRAAVMLHKLAEEQPDALPHYSIGSRSVFGRLTAPALLDAAAEQSAQERLLYHERVVRLYEQIFLIYARQQARQGGFDTDVAELGGFLLLATAHLAEDLGAARNEVADTSRADFEAGADALTGGMAQTLRGVLQMATDETALSLDARKRLLNFAVRSSPGIARVLTGEQRAALASEIAALHERRELSDLHAELAAMRHALAP